MAVSQITHCLLLAGVDKALSPALLSSRNVTLVVNASGQEVAYPRATEVLLVPVQDRPHAPLAAYFDIVAERIHGNQTGTTLVHCTAGRSRSPSLVMAYLMRYKGVSLRQAYEWVLEERPHIRPNAGFWRQLLAYETRLTGRTTLKMAATPAGVLPEAGGDALPSYCINA